MRVLPVLFLLLLTACSSSTPERRESPALPSSVEAQLKVAAEPPVLSLNVGITVFDIQEPVENSLQGALKQVRSVEQRYVPYELKKTLDRSGYWGAVRVMPREDLSAEMNISGSVLESDGVVLKLAIKAIDASGRVWLDEIYEDAATDDDYSKDPDYNKDPFQGLYNRIANDLSRALEPMSEADLQSILDIATVVYGRALSEEAFGRYLIETEEGLVLAGLPAANDPAFERIQRIRDSEYLFADSIDAHYESLQRQLGQTYAWWRHYSYELIMGNRRLETVDATRGATRGTYYSLNRVYKTFRDSKMNEDALRELTDSFDRETEPTVTEIAGKVVQLHGTLDFQVDEWRRLLRQAWEQETGF